MKEKSFDTLSRMADFLNSPNANSIREAIVGTMHFIDKYNDKINKQKK